MINSLNKIVNYFNPETFLNLLESDNEKVKETLN